MGRFTRAITYHVVAGRIPCGEKKGNLWLIPLYAQKSEDKRRHNKSEPSLGKTEQVKLAAIKFSSGTQSGQIITSCGRESGLRAAQISIFYWNYSQCAMHIDSAIKQIEQWLALFDASRRCRRTKSLFRIGASCYVWKNQQTHITQTTAPFYWFILQPAAGISRPTVQRIGNGRNNRSIYYRVRNPDYKARSYHNADRLDIVGNVFWAYVLRYADAKIFALLLYHDIRHISGFVH